MPPPVLLVFSHLRWQSHELRQQHLLSRLAGRWQVLFVEPVQPATGAPWLEVLETPDLAVLTPHMPSAGAPADTSGVQQWLLRQYLDAHQLQPDTAWLSTPLALPVARALGAGRLVYDCVEELWPVYGSQPQLHECEVELLREAALVLTSGPALQDVRRHLHPNVHCLPNAVDLLHFAPGDLKHGSALAQHADALQAHLPRPRLGYAGVIDHRLDLDLVATLAERHPGWALIMAGPVVGVPAERLPRHANIHWLGPQSYDARPHLLAGWDLALMPFVLDEVTRWMNPPQTLEYMAAGLPVVATPVYDLQALYFPAVTLASADRFEQACIDLLREGTLARSARLVEMRRHAGRSWDELANTVHLLLLQAGLGVQGTPPQRAADPAAERPGPARASKRTAARA
jgi:UDP-galactopyranose mutase